MENCNYCDFDYQLANYAGKEIKPHKSIDGSRQDIEIQLAVDGEYECTSIVIDGTFIDIRIEIKYCPMCGKKL